MEAFDGTDDFVLVSGVKQLSVSVWFPKLQDDNADVNKHFLTKLAAEYMILFQFFKIVCLPVKW